MVIILQKLISILRIIYLFLGNGISHYVDNPSQAGESLKECLDEAEDRVPKSDHKETLLYLGATAGMRLLRLVAKVWRG